MKRLKDMGQWCLNKKPVMMKSLERIGQWCLDRLPYYICYGAVILAVVIIVAQAGIHKGRQLRSAEVTKLRRDVKVLKGGIGELTGLMQDKCMAVWRGEDKDELVVRNYNRGVSHGKNQD